MFVQNFSQLGHATLSKTVLYLDAHIEVPPGNFYTNKFLFPDQ